MTPPLLHLTTPAEWRVALGSGRIAPPSLEQVGFVHLSTPEQVALPADRLFHGRRDLVLLVLDPARVGVEVRYEPGVPSDPASMRFPHAYGPVPVTAVTTVLPYRPRGDGGFDAPAVPDQDPTGRSTGFVPSLLRRIASSEIPVTGGVAVFTAKVPASHHHNQLLVDGEVDAAQLAADADRVLGGAGLAHRQALLTGADHAETAAGLADRGWRVDELVGMAAPAGGTPDPRVEHLDLEAVRPMWEAAWRRTLPGVDDNRITQLVDRYAAEEAVVDLRYLAVRSAGTVVAAGVLEIDGATAALGALETAPADRGRGLGAAVVSEALAVAGAVGCDLVVLRTLAADRTRRWFARRGFTEVARSWSVESRPTPTTRLPAVMS